MKNENIVTIVEEVEEAQEMTTEVKESKFAKVGAKTKTFFAKYGKPIAAVGAVVIAGIAGVLVGANLNKQDEDDVVDVDWTETNTDDFTNIGSEEE